MSSSSWKTTGWSPMPQTYNLPRRGQPGPALPQVSLQSFICHDGSIMTVECPYFSKFPVNKIAVWFMFIASLHSYKLYFYWLLPVYQKGRIPYTSEEDAAIIGYVATLKDKLKGNLLWKQMAEIHLTQHSWQSMKYHYIYKLMDRATEAKEQGRRNGDSMVKQPWWNCSSSGIKAI